MFWAERRSEARRHEASSQFKKLKCALEKKVLDGLYQLWSPEQISGRLKLEGFFDQSRGDLSVRAQKRPEVQFEASREEIQS